MEREEGGEERGEERGIRNKHAKRVAVDDEEDKSDPEVEPIHPSSHVESG